MGNDGDAGTLTAQEAFTQGMAANPDWNPADSQNPTWLAAVYAQIQSMQLNVAWSVGPQCSSAIVNSDQIVQQAVNVAGIAAGTGAAIAGGIAAPITGGISAIAGLIVGIFTGHHQAAVRAEMSARCAGMLAANASLAQIQQALTSGAIDYAEASQLLDTVYSQWQSTTASVYSTSPYCNATCEMDSILKALVLYWKSQYAELSAQQAAAASASASPTTDSTAGATGTVANNSVPATGTNWFTEQTIVPALPNWGVLAGAALGIMALGSVL